MKKFGGLIARQRSYMIAMRSNEVLTQVYRHRRQELDDIWEEYWKENNRKREDLLEERRRIRHDWD